jgi:vitamin B12 transporter
LELNQENQMKQKQLIAVLLCAVTPLTQAAAEVLDEVVVTATRVTQPLKQSLSSTTVITQQDIQAAQAVDVPALLKNLAGVETYQSGGVGQQSSLFMRGANSSHTLVLLDGVRINSATTGATAIDQLMLDQIERIEVVRGNVSSIYGSEAIGGVIQIFTKHGKGAPSFNVSGGAGTYNTSKASAGFGGEVGQTSFSVQGSRFKTDGVSAIKPGLVPKINPDSDGYANTSLSANVRQAFSNEHSLSASAFQSLGDVQYDSTSAAKTDANTNTSSLSKFSLVADDRFAESWASKLQWAQGVDDYKSYLNGAQSSSLRTNNDQLAWQNTLTVIPNGSLLLGVERLDQRVTSTTAYTKTTRQVDSLLAGYTGSYGIQQVQLNVRQDTYSDFGASSTGLLGYGISVNEAWRVTASVSTAFKAPTFTDLYGPAGWGSNAKLNPERSNNSELGLHYVESGQQLHVAYFDNHITDLIAADNTYTLQNLNSARINGVEATYAAQIGQTSFRAALTQQDPRDEKTGLVLLRRAKFFSNVGVSHQVGAWSVGGEWQHSGERVDYDINTFARTTLGTYDVVNASASYAWDRHLTVALHAGNLFDKDYMLAHGYNTLGRTLFVGISYQ